jgi:hypothetical protein
MSVAFARALGLVATLLGIVPVLLGALRFGARERAYQLAWAWFMVMGGCGLAMLWVVYNGGRTTELQHISLPIILAMGLFAFGASTQRRGLRLVYLFLGIGFVVLWSVSRISNEYRGDFNAFIGPVYALILTLAAAIMMADRLRVSAMPPLRDPVVILGVGTLATFAPSAAIEPVSAAIYGSHPVLTQALWIGRMGFVVVGSVLFTLVMLWTTPPRSSSGSSSSVA